MFRFADLFAGIGGFRKAFESLGGECVLSVEKDKYCKISQEANFTDSEQHVWMDDIRTVSAEDVSDMRIDLVCAGFPCQPFSRSGVSKNISLGKQHGFQHTHGTLFFDLARLLDTIRPRVFLLENVPNLKSHDEGRTFQIIMHTLSEELGYSVHHRTVCSSPWVAQKRKRVFILGTLQDTLFNPLDQISFPQMGRYPILADILETSVNNKYRFTENQIATAARHRQNHREKGNGFGAVVVSSDQQCPTLTKHYHRGGMK